MQRGDRPLNNFKGDRPDQNHEDCDFWRDRSDFIAIAMGNVAEASQNAYPESASQKFALS